MAAAARIVRISTLFSLPYSFYDPDRRLLAGDPLASLGRATVGDALTGTLLNRRLHPYSIRRNVDFIRAPHLSAVSPELFQTTGHDSPHLENRLHHRFSTGDAQAVGLYGGKWGMAAVLCQEYGAESPAWDGTFSICLSPSISPCVSGLAVPGRQSKAAAIFACISVPAAGRNMAADSCREPTSGTAIAEGAA